MFGKLMSISDELMARYYPLLIGRMMPADMHPMDAKKQLALEITATYHSRDMAQKTLEDWQQRFSEKRLAEAELPTIEFQPFNEVCGNQIIDVVSGAYSQAFQIHNKSRSDIRRLIEQGSIQLDGKKINDPKAQLDLKPGQVLRLDKTHAVRIA
jgi:tyrosyl-tRNA synthetase